MSLLLSIDTATEYAGVCISENAHVIAQKESYNQKNHGTFVQPAIESLCNIAGIQLQQVDAIIVSAGPGSYTGLRVGLSTAKGLCYALQKPLVLVNTLEVMAYALIKSVENSVEENTLFCPMIDARRMEVFTALFNKELTYIQQPAAIILNEIPDAFFPVGQTVYFSGNGSNKLKDIQISVKRLISSVQHSIEDVAVLGYKAFEKQAFTNLAYSEPLYIKEFFTHQSTQEN